LKLIFVFWFIILVFCNSDLEKKFEDVKMKLDVTLGTNRKLIRRELNEVIEVIADVRKRLNEFINSQSNVIEQIEQKIMVLERKNLDNIYTSTESIYIRFIKFVYIDE
jgi:prefoldin subunit 5